MRNLAKIDMRRTEHPLQLLHGYELPADRLGEYEFAGELALTGELRRIRGTLAMMCGASRDEVVFAAAALVVGIAVLAAQRRSQ